MRRRAKKGPLSVLAVAGSYVVMLGINMNKKESAGVLGFAIERIDHDNNDKHDWLLGFKTFPGTRLAKNEFVSTRKHPIQSFLWSDFTTRLGHRYTYRIVAMRGAPGSLVEGEDVSVTIAMEREDEGTHAVYFNRGIAGSQAYARKFGNKRPQSVANRAAWKWLSRGLEEAIIAFIDQAKGPGQKLRAAIYEFQHEPVLDAFRRAAERGVDVKIIVDARANNSDPELCYPKVRNEEAIMKAGIGDLVVPRTKSPSYIAHNKFIVLADNDVPVKVWTGSTNITDGGIFGHSNVGHLVRDREVAASFMSYWEELSGDPSNTPLKTWTESTTPVPADLPPKKTTTIFSPRKSLEALEWYSARMDAAPGAIFFTAAFGVNDLLANVLRKKKDYLRYVLLESEGRTEADKRKLAEIQSDRLNRVAVGSVLGKGAFDRWIEERTTGLNEHVKYIHTKYMLIDPLGKDPLVITGSANFSNASTRDNDENMLVIRGNRRVAEIYLGEFMRLFGHHYFRYIQEQFNARDEVTGKKGNLAPDDSWRLPYYEPGTPKALEREYFG